MLVVIIIIIIIINTSFTINISDIYTLSFQPSHHTSLIVRFQTQIVLDLFYILTTVCSCDQYSLIRRVSSCSLSSTDMPSVTNH